MRLLRVRGVRRELTITAGLLLSACLPNHESTPVPSTGRTCPSTVAGTASSALTWYYPVEEQDNRSLEQWCAVVGPPVFDSSPSGEFGGLGQADSLAVTAWNADVGSGFLVAMLREQLGLECAGSDSRLLAGHSHFVLLVQEALRRSQEIPEVKSQWSVPPPIEEEPRPGPRLDIVEVARDCGLALAYVPGARNGHAERDGKREDKGEAILSTLPLSDLIAIELPYEAARRVAVAATIQNQRGDSLRVVSVHMISMTPPWRLLQTANSSRQRQALATVDALRLVDLERTGAGRRDELTSCYPVCAANHSAEYLMSTIVAGDLNTWSTRETAFRHLREFFPDSPPTLSNPTVGPFPADHIFFRSSAVPRLTTDRVIDMSYRRIEDTYYSDHHPIFAWFRFGSR
jgi:endonuclease/exonuclease/phosphatase family metal-dependent hydrolase